MDGPEGQLERPDPRARRNGYTARDLAGQMAYSAGRGADPARDQVRHLARLDRAGGGGAGAGALLRGLYGAQGSGKPCREKRPVPGGGTLVADAELPEDPLSAVAVGHCADQGLFQRPQRTLVYPSVFLPSQEPSSAPRSFPPRSDWQP